MTDIAIRVENLSKLYKIGARQNRHDTLRDKLTEVVTAPFRRLSSVLDHSSSVIGPRSSVVNSSVLGPRSSVVSNDTIWALKDVSFSVKRGEVVGIIGRNGAGKTTLLKILSRITEPTEGYAEIHGRVRSLLEVGTGFHPELTGRENIYLNGAILGMKKAEINRKFDEIVAFAEIEKFIDTPVKHYSSGMYVRLAFAVAAHLEPEILLVDEVLAVGDASFQKKCLGKMENVAKEGRTVLFVSHNMGAVQHLCNSALLLENGRLLFLGRTAETIDFYERQILLSEASREHPHHVIFDLDVEFNEPQSDFEIVRLETLGADGVPKPVVSTWDRVLFRISYWARHSIREGSVALWISTREGVPLLLCSTQPDATVPMTIEVGVHTVECEFPSLPFSAGDYIIGAGLAIPNKEWLCKRDQLGWLTIRPKDVYKSGWAPTAARSILAVPHMWRIT